MRSILKYIIVACLLLMISHSTYAETGAETDSNMINLKLKILTLNIHSGVNWYGQYDLDSLAKFIADVNPDIVGLQEVDRGWGKRSQFQDISAELADRLKMFFSYSVSLERNQGYFGNQILSKYPIVQNWAEQLPSFKETRSFIFTQVMISGVRVNVLNMHLGLSEEDRLTQVQESLRFLNQIAGPQIIMGDFNADTKDPAVALLRKEFTDLQAQTDLVGHGTFREKNGNFGERMDYILTSPEFFLQRMEVVDNYLSDHLPVIAEVNLWIDSSRVSAQPVFQ